MDARSAEKCVEEVRAWATRLGTRRGATRTHDTKRSISFPGALVRHVHVAAPHVQPLGSVTDDQVILRRKRAAATQRKREASDARHMYPCDTAEHPPRLWCRQSVVAN